MQTIEFNPMIPIRAVAAAEFYSGGVRQISFFDDTDTVARVCNPTNNKETMRKIKLEPNQQLIGVYGSYGYTLFWQKIILSFGFIVKVKDAVS